MALLDLLTCSRQADELCLVYCKAHANIMLDCKDSQLIHLISNTEKSHIVWVDPGAEQNGMSSYVRAFYEFNGDGDDDLGCPLSRTVITPDKDIFCYNGNAYFLHRFENGNMSIRQLTMFGTQSAVESLEKFSEAEAKIPLNIFLAEFSLVNDNKLEFVLMCWGIAYEGECNYVSVFDDDSHYLQEYDVGTFVRREVPVGFVFKKNDFYYKLLQDDEGKLILDRSLSIFMLGTSQQKKFPEGHHARIIAFNPSGGV